MTNEEYHNHKAISSSDFSLIEISPLHFQNKDHFKLSGDAFDFGSLVHTLTLEPEKFEEEYIIPPKFDLRTKKGKEDKKAFEEKYHDKTIIDEDKYQIALKMAENIKLIAGGLLKNGVTEQSFFTKDDLGLDRKCRPDYYIEEYGLVIDIKTTKSCNPYDFKKSIYDYNYHRQAAYYLDTLKLAGKRADKFIIIAVEKTSPYMVRVFEIDEVALEIGKEEFLNLLKSYKSFLDSGKCKIINKISLPEWAIKQNQY